MIVLLKNLRLISVLGSCASVSLLFVNLVLMLFIENTATKLHYSWVTFFTITFITLISTLTGYLLNERRRRLRRIKKVLDFLILLMNNFISLSRHSNIAYISSDKNRFFYFDIKFI